MSMVDKLSAVLDSGISKPLNAGNRNRKGACVENSERALFLPFLCQYARQETKLDPVSDPVNAISYVVN